MAVRKGIAELNYDYIDIDIDDTRMLHFNQYDIISRKNLSGSGIGVIIGVTVKEDKNVIIIVCYSPIQEVYYF